MSDLDQASLASLHHSLQMAGWTPPTLSNTTPVQPAASYQTPFFSQTPYQPLMQVPYTPPHAPVYTANASTPLTNRKVKNGGDAAECCCLAASDCHFVCCILKGIGACLGGILHCCCSGCN